MLSEEEISKLKINIFNQCDDETIKLFADILKYTEQVETREQKLIEKLEEDLNDLGEQTKDNYLREKANYTIRYLSEYRKILKGEKE